MTKMILKMNACLQVEVGMKVYYDCPHTSGESFQADNFFRKYKGSTGTVVGFSTEYVEPLDIKGRLPGVYYRSSGISVQFDGEDQVHEGLNIGHFVLMSPAKTVSPDTPLTHQRAGDLPHPILFYPGDVVNKADDLLCIERLVERVSITKEGIPVYTLAETEEDRNAREAEDEAQRKEARDRGSILASMRSSLERTEKCYGKELKMLKPGNVHWLYNDPSKMRFTSPKDEVYFWARDGLSSTAYQKGGLHPVWEYSHEKARELLEAGEGDLIVRCKTYKNVKVSERDGDHKLRRLLDCFAEHRDCVRSLALNLETPPGEVERSTGDVAMSLLSAL